MRASRRHQLLLLHVFMTGFVHFKSVALQRGIGWGYAHLLPLPISIYCCVSKSFHVGSRHLIKKNNRRNNDYFYTQSFVEMSVFIFLPSSSSFFDNKNMKRKIVHFFLTTILCFFMFIWIWKLEKVPLLLVRTGWCTFFLSSFLVKWRHYREVFYILYSFNVMERTEEADWWATKHFNSPKST